MSLGDIFKAKENNQLKTRIAELEKLLTPEMQDSMQLQDRINQQQQILSTLQRGCAEAAAEQEALLQRANAELTSVKKQITQARSELVETED